MFVRETELQARIALGSLAALGHSSKKMNEVMAYAERHSKPTGDSSRKIEYWVIGKYWRAVTDAYGQAWLAAKQTTANIDRYLGLLKQDESELDRKIATFKGLGFASAVVGVALSIPGVKERIGGIISKIPVIGKILGNRVHGDVEKAPARLKSRIGSVMKMAGQMQVQAEGIAKLLESVPEVAVVPEQAASGAALRAFMNTLGVQVSSGSTNPQGRWYYYARLRDELKSWEAQLRGRVNAYLAQKNRVMQKAGELKSTSRPALPASVAVTSAAPAAPTAPAAPAAPVEKKGIGTVLALAIPAFLLLRR